jgi:hypothetical protein
MIKDGMVSMKDLDTYVSEAVPGLTRGAQHPTTNTPDGYVDFSVAKVSQQGNGIYFLLNYYFPQRTRRTQRIGRKPSVFPVSSVGNLSFCLFEYR